MMTVIGTVAGALAVALATWGAVVFFTAASEAVEGLDKALRSGESAQSGKTLQLGEAASFNNGLKLTVTEIESFTPENEFEKAAEGHRLVKVTVVAENTAEDTQSVLLSSVNMRAGESNAQARSSYAGGFKELTGDLAPGAKATGTYLFEVAESDLGKLQVQVGMFIGDSVFWEGSLKE
nr:hypothetical protein GCM10020093_014860 [Planobispora longispora]